MPQRYDKINNLNDIIIIPQYRRLMIYGKSRRKIIDILISRKTSNKTDYIRYRTAISGQRNIVWI